MRRLFTTTAGECKGGDSGRVRQVIPVLDMDAMILSISPSVSTSRDVKWVTRPSVIKL